MTSPAASRAGFLVFVTFIALLAGEFSGGTFRVLLLREPHRLRVIVGKVAGILVAASAVVALAEALTFGLSLALAPAQDIATANWSSLDGVATGLGNYAKVMAGVAGWAVFGTTLAVVFRSVPGPSAWASPGPARSRTSSSTRGPPVTGCSPVKCSAPSSRGAPLSSHRPSPGDRRRLHRSGRRHRPVPRGPKGCDRMTAVLLAHHHGPGHDGWFPVARPAELPLRRSGVPWAAWHASGILLPWHECV